MAEDEFLIVSIGSSAGGVEPCVRLVREVPADAGLAIVIVNHLRRGPTILPQILARATSMRTQLITTGTTAKHFTSWLTLAPGNKISGGRVLSSKTRRSSNRAAALLRIAAVNVGKTQTALGAFYRRLSARAGKAKAVTATARKLAVLFYRALRFGLAYADPGAGYYEERYKQRAIENLQRRARGLGFTLAAIPETDGVS